MKAEIFTYIYIYWLYSTYNMVQQLFTLITHVILECYHLLQQ